MPGTVSGGELDPGNGGQEFLGVGVLRAVKDDISGSVFHDLAGIHHGDVIGEVANYREVVGNKDHGQIQFVAQFEEKIENLGLDGNVQSGYRFIREHQFRFGCEGAGDGNPLSLTTREFVGIFPHEAGVEADPFHDFSHFADQTVSGVAETPTLAECLGEGRVDGHAGIEGGVGILKDHLEVETPFLDGGGPQSAEILSLEENFAGGGRLELHDGAGEGGFAAAGLPDESQDLTLFDPEADPIDSAHQAGDPTEGSLADGKVGVNIDEFEEGHGGRKALIPQ